MIRRLRSDQFSPRHLATLAIAWLCVMLAARPTPAAAQGAAQTGTIGGKVVDEEGAPVGGAQLFIQRTSAATQTRSNGEYVLERAPVGTQTLQVRMLGFRPDSASVVIAAGERATQDFTLRRNPLQLQTMV